MRIVQDFLLFCFIEKFKNEGQEDLDYLLP